MIEITEELIDQLKEYAEQEKIYPFEEFTDSMKNNFIGLHVDEKEASKFLEACQYLYDYAYDEGYDKLLLALR